MRRGRIRKECRIFHLYFARSRGGVTANNTEAKRLADWKVASKKYIASLDEMTDALRTNAEAVPAVDILTGLAKLSRVIERASKSFRDDVDRAEKSAPEPPNPYNDH